MNHERLVQNFELRISQICSPFARYSVLWLVGKPRSGKTSLSRAVCMRKNWQYVNFTLDRGYLDHLSGLEETYRPEDFVEDLRSIWLAQGVQLAIIDEIEPLLALWDWEQQEVFFKLASRLTRLTSGVVLVTRLRTSKQIARLVPKPDHIFEISEGAEP